GRLFDSGHAVPISENFPDNLALLTGSAQGEKLKWNKVKNWDGLRWERDAGFKRLKLLQWMILHLAFCLFFS
ncbi:MAG: hypothetical protein J7J61_02220, partial [Candidatus Hydrothermae bacterium]|nr:hypothetical protein [Candidatus Hydrothermae bacterium]